MTAIAWAIIFATLVGLDVSFDIFKIDRGKTKGTLSALIILALGLALFCTIMELRR